jgi:hypothetical protein
MMQLEMAKVPAATVVRETAVVPTLLDTYEVLE